MRCLSFILFSFFMFSCSRFPVKIDILWSDPVEIIVSDDNNIAIKLKDYTKFDCNDVFLYIDKYSFIEYVKHNSHDFNISNDKFSLYILPSAVSKGSWNYISAEDARRKMMWFISSSDDFNYHSLCNESKPYVNILEYKINGSIYKVYISTLVAGSYKNVDEFFK